jgi:hypothetical protein
VPVYLGAPNWEEFVPWGRDAVIDAGAFDSPHELADFLKKLAGDEARYEGIRVKHACEDGESIVKLKPRMCMRLRAPHQVRAVPRVARAAAAAPGARAGADFLLQQLVQHVQLAPPPPRRRVWAVLEARVWGVQKEGRVTHCRKGI